MIPIRRGLAGVFQIFLRRSVAARVLLRPLLPYFISSILHPSGFDITTFRDNVGHGFRRTNCVNPSAKLNKNAKCSKIK